MDNCIFCKIAKGEEKCWKVFENDNVVAFFDYNPVNEYHTLVIPKQHYKDIFNTPKEELQHIISAIKEIVTIYREKLGINNIQIINSSGEEAQQDVFHIHFHIVPRKIGDGQDIKWKPKEAIRKEFDVLLTKIY
ncbi:MAG: HIT domain-containing protein [Candidatus Pacebacteria bacterium]|nr:HIT domain-containing protein [Candidatus Paceibacterota bacterium]